MPSLSRTHRLVGSAVTLSALAIALLATVQGDVPPEARILPRIVEETPWRIITQEEMKLGASAPKNTHVAFHLPDDFGSITFDILFGQASKDVRFWGYCFPSNYNPNIVERREGLPGQIFLSDAERKARSEELEAVAPRFSLFRLPLRKDTQEGFRQRSRIRHQVEIFRSSMLCYLMSEEDLAIGLDDDGDKLNNRLEIEIGTDGDIPDSDNDGITDGIEYLFGIDPLLRDTDGDSLVDGLEDTNWDGIIDQDETDPRNKDTDREGLCDGICRVRIGKQQLFFGEDKNLNGQVDEDETDPRLPDTDGDGITDFQAELNCQLGNKDFCPDDQQ